MFLALDDTIDSSSFSNSSISPTLSLMNSSELLTSWQLDQHISTPSNILPLNGSAGLLELRYNESYSKMLDYVIDIFSTTTNNLNFTFEYNKYQSETTEQSSTSIVNKLTEMTMGPTVKGRRENQINFLDTRTNRHYLNNNSISFFGRSHFLDKSRDSPLNQLIETVSPVQNEESEQYIFDKPAVKFTLIVLFTIVFITGLIGNLIVLVVMYLHPRMKSTTNFFLTNLAIADLCVIIFCVLQNLSLYLAHSWVLGNFMCKMYSFVHHLSYTSSVMILVVNCVERYLAIMRPFKAKTLLRHSNLFVSLVIVWVCSGIYCSPKLIFFKAVEHQLGSDELELICLADRKLYNSKIFDTINFFLLYLVPLILISVFYFKIARYLWVNGSQIENQLRQDLSGTSSQQFVSNMSQSTEIDQRKYFQQLQKEQYDYENRPLNVRNTISDTSVSRYSFKSGRISRIAPKKKIEAPLPAEQKVTLRIGPYHSYVLIRTWRKVVRLLITVVLSFAICNLPFHIRKMLSYYYPGYNSVSDFALLSTPITNLLTYLNSALNPLLYSFMSHNFRSCVKDVLTCRYNIRGRRRTTGDKILSHNKAFEMKNLKKKQSEVKTNVLNEIDTISRSKT